MTETIERATFMQEEREERRDRPDPGGIVLRREAATFVREFVEDFGRAPRCHVGRGSKRRALAPEPCERAGVMQVYGLVMCEEHGEEAAGGALAEIAFDLDTELERPLNDHVAGLSPHLAEALRRAHEFLPSEVYDALNGGRNGDLLRAFPLDRDRTDAEILGYVEAPDDDGRRGQHPPFDSFMDARMVLHKHMRLAFEEGVDWLVETLERERELVAAQAAYALALETEAGLR